MKHDHHTGVSLNEQVAQITYEAGLALCGPEQTTSSVRCTECVPFQSGDNGYFRK